MDALREILNTGLSAKNEFGDTKRGTGLRNTRLAITNKVLKGEFLIASGNAAFFQSAEVGGKFGHLTDYEWRGTILMLRINRPMSRFNLYDYVR